MRLFGYPYNDLVICKDSPDYLIICQKMATFSARLTCAWQYFGTLIFELFFEIIRPSVDKINFLFLC